MSTLSNNQTSQCHRLQVSLNNFYSLILATRDYDCTFSLTVTVYIAVYVIYVYDSAMQSIHFNALDYAHQASNF